MAFHSFCDISICPSISTSIETPQLISRGVSLILDFVVHFLSLFDRFLWNTKDGRVTDGVGIEGDVEAGSVFPLVGARNLAV